MDIGISFYKFICNYIDEIRVDDKWREPHPNILDVLITKFRLDEQLKKAINSHKNMIKYSSIYEFIENTLDLSPTYCIIIKHFGLNDRDINSRLDHANIVDLEHLVVYTTGLLKEHFFHTTYVLDFNDQLEELLCDHKYLRTPHLIYQLYFNTVLSIFANDMINIEVKLLEVDGDK